MTRSGFGIRNYLLLAIATGVAAQSLRQETAVTFQGRPAVVRSFRATDPQLAPKESASVCIQTKCYSAPEGYYADAKAVPIQLDKNSHALWFTAEAVGTSGGSIHMALLQPDASENLHNILLEQESLSNLGQHLFLDTPTKVLVTATYTAGLNEAHYDSHRYLISVYTRQFHKDGDVFLYALADRYLTAKTYEFRSNANIIRSERAEILRRLRQVAPKK